MRRAPVGPSACMSASWSSRLARAARSATTDIGATHCHAHSHYWRHTASPGNHPLQASSQRHRRPSWCLVVVVLLASPWPLFFKPRRSVRPGGDLSFAACPNAPSAAPADPRRACGGSPSPAASVGIRPLARWLCRARPGGGLFVDAPHDAPHDAPLIATTSPRNLAGGHR